MAQRLLIEHDRMEVVLLRLSHELLENHRNFDNCCLVGIQPRGVFLARRLNRILNDKQSVRPFQFAELDVTFHRDDYRRHDTPLVPASTHAEPGFSTEGKTVILVDDVLYTGRTVQAALIALQAFGRPHQVQLLVLVDRRRKRELPIEAHYVGVAVDTLDKEQVFVHWSDVHSSDQVLIQSQQHA